MNYTCTYLSTNSLIHNNNNIIIINNNIINNNIINNNIIINKKKMTRLVVLGECDVLTDRIAATDQRAHAVQAYRGEQGQ
jgi:hypothetical protein